MAYKHATTRLQLDMAVRYSGNADKDFAAIAAVFRKGAVELAKIELQYGTDSEMRQLAEQIIAGDEKEIALMRAWSAKHE